MIQRILILGATGMLGAPVTHHLLEAKKQVRVLVRDSDKARRILGDKAEIFEGNVLVEENLREAMENCDAVHLSLPYYAELEAMRYVVEIGKMKGLKRITYISAATVNETNRWFDLIDIKMRAEAVLSSSGIPNTVFCPTWAMETLQNFIHEDRAVIIFGKNPPPLHFVSAVDLGRMVAKSYDDNRALGKRLFIHGPESLTLPKALERFIRTCYSDRKTMRMPLWQARLIAKFMRSRDLSDAVKLIAYFDKVEEMGDPAEANALLGTPSITLDEWFGARRIGVEV